MIKHFLHRPFILIILFIQLLLSCGQNQQSDETATENIAFQTVQISIDTFSTFPPEIDGCACYFSINETEFKNNKFIYVSDHGNIAFVSINGVLTKFVLTKSHIILGEGSVETFVNDNYKITVDVKQVGQIDETWQQSGTIKIKPKAGKEIIKSIYGECGC